MIGDTIEQESFQIIQSELGAHDFTPEELAIVLRTIHATADFEYANLIRFSPSALDCGFTALRRGCKVITDVNMVIAGVNRERANLFHLQTRCDIDLPEVRDYAQSMGITRAAAAMRRLGLELDGALIAIGNAPTALLEVIRLAEDGQATPALVIGVPVGFVRAAESKELLQGTNLPYITVQGRKGGSTVAAAIINAMMKLVTP